MAIAEKRSKQADPENDTGEIAANFRRTRFGIPHGRHDARRKTDDTQAIASSKAPHPRLASAIALHPPFNFGILAVARKIHAPLMCCVNPTSGCTRDDEENGHIAEER